MVKKLLTLSLVAVMLSVTALAAPGGVMLMDATYAAEPTTLTDVSVTAITDADATAQGIEKPVEYLWVAQTTTEDVVSQKITKVTFPSSAKTMGEGNWVLARYNVGKNITFTKMTPYVRFQMIDNDASSSNPQTVTLYCAPLSYTDYAAAAAIAGTSDTMSTLVKPKSDDANVKTYSLKKTATNSAQNFSPSLDVDVFNNSSEYYHDGYVYLAFWANGQDGNYDEKLAVQSTTSGQHYTHHRLLFSGTQETPAVDDFSDSVITWNDGAYTVTTSTASGTAMLVAASFNGETMVDAKIATIDAATAVDGVISGTITDLTAGDKVRVYLWANNTLVPAIGVTEF